MHVRHLRCPNCGATLNAEEDRRLIKCAFCRQSIQLTPSVDERPVNPAPVYQAPAPPPVVPTVKNASSRTWLVTALVVGSVAIGVVPVVLTLVVRSATMVGETVGAGNSTFNTAWSASASSHRGQNGTRYVYECPAGGSRSSVWGSGPYTDDSSVCTAAVHAGVITFAQGGTVRIEIRGGRGSYGASTAHGVTTGSWGAFDGSFVVLGADDTSAQPKPGPSSATWSTPATPFRGSNGKKVSYQCPPGGSRKPVWGSGPYTDDSSVCTAAVHAGAITFAKGGTVRIEIRGGRGSYGASTAHGVTTGSWGAFDGSFVVLGAGGAAAGTATK